MLCYSSLLIYENDVALNEDDTLVSLCVYLQIHLYIAGAPSLCSRVSNGGSLHTSLFSCQILTIRTFHFLLGFPVRHPSALTPLLLLSRHSGSLFGVLSGAPAVVVWSWQRALSRLYLAHSTQIVNWLKRAKRSFEAF